MQSLTIVLTVFAMFVLLADARANCKAPYTSRGEEKDTSAYLPIILTQDVKVDPIMNNADPVFALWDILVKIPGLMRKDSSQVCRIDIGIHSSNVRDLKTDSVYNVIVADIGPLQQMSLESIQKSRDFWRPTPRNQRELPSELLPEPRKPPKPPKRAEINADTLRYCATLRATLKLVGGKIPLRKGQVKGHVVLNITATYVDLKGIAHRSSRTQNIQITN